MWWVAIIAACALALSGCGTNDSRAEIEAVVERFQQALGDGDITSASADVPGRGTAFLDQTPYGWRISAAGCSPTSPGLPYDCELEV